MLKSIRTNLIGTISVILIVLNTLFWSLLLFPITFLKLIFRFKAAMNLCTRILNGIAYTWILCNNLAMKFTRQINWHITGDTARDTGQWYLVLANHQSWVDIVVLQKIFHGRIPFLKFFLKKELIWVPIMGLAWWALDFPFMKRYSNSFLEKNPHLRGKDIEITRKACEKFKKMPVTVMNFVEGTRFTTAKKRNKSPPSAIFCARNRAA